MGVVRLQAAGTDIHAQDNTSFQYHEIAETIVERGIAESVDVLVARRLPDRFAIHIVTPGLRRAALVHRRHKDPAAERSKEAERVIQGYRCVDAARSATRGDPFQREYGLVPQVLTDITLFHQHTGVGLGSAQRGQGCIHHCEGISGKLFGSGDSGGGIQCLTRHGNAEDRLSYQHGDAFCVETQAAESGITDTVHIAALAGLRFLGRIIGPGIIACPHRGEHLVERILVRAGW